MFTYIKNSYKGKLTYTMALVAIVWGVTGYLAGWIDAGTASKVIWGGLTIFGIRRAIN